MSPVAERVAAPLSPRKDRPFVWVNCATSVDGRLAYAHGARANLSGREDLIRVQRLRLSVDAILVGVGTVVLDDPSLRVHRELLGEDPGPSADGARSGPLRVVLDSQGRTPEKAKVLDGKQPTVIFTSDSSRRRFPDAVTVVPAGRSKVALRTALRWLLRKGVRAVLVEGGSQVIAAFVREGIVDRMTVYVAPVVIGGTTAPTLAGGEDRPGPEGAVPLSLVSVERIGEGVLLTYEPRASSPS
jgi:2,5-diamino-6-(ribosylamino)-4(3H)-pyrimidinone 5'-phosphate reductase